MAILLSVGILAIACALRVKAVFERALKRMGGIFPTFNLLIPKARIVTRRFKAFTKLGALFLVGDFLIRVKIQFIRYCIKKRVLNVVTIRSGQR